MTAGIASLASAAVMVPRSQAALPKDIKPKKKGQIQVVYLGGDSLHSGFTQELSIRGILNRTGWRLLFARDATHVTPELLRDTDLFFATRWGGGGGEGWLPGPIVEGNRPGETFLTPEMEKVVIDNVVNRGMGFISCHCTIANGGNVDLINMMGIVPMMHGPVQTVHMHNINQDHPISRGIEEFDVALDENFGVQLVDKKAVRLFDSTGRSDHRHDVAGWCIEQGKGRIVGLVAGHTYTSWRHPLYRKMIWRAAHWAVRKDIPEFS